ncbi:MAG: helix-turn-helix domain-containing protein [Gammaproteobacteria bacterium]
MQEHQVTISEVAICADLPTPVVLRIKSGEMQDPRLSVAEQLATAFNINVSQITGKEPITSSSVDRAKIYDYRKNLTK